MSKKKNDKPVAEACSDAGKFQRVVIRDPKVSRLGLELGGTGSLILNDFSQKMIEEMLTRHMGGNVERQKKNPRECIENAISRNIEGAVAVPTTAFKLASIAGAAGLTGRTFQKTNLRLTFGISGQSVPIKFEKMTPRMDIVRLKNGSPDVRFRPEFIGWSVRVVVEFAEPLNAEAAVDLVQRGGRVGIGEWRPQKNGTHGTYRVIRTLSDEELLEAVVVNAVPMRSPTIPEWALDLNIDFTQLLEATSGEESRDLADEVDRSDRKGSNGRREALA